MTRPPDIPLPMAGILAMAMLTLLTYLSPTSAQTTAISATSWTFSKPGKCYIRFSPPLSSSQVLKLELSFRMLQPNGLLLYQDMAENRQEMEEQVKLLLDSFYFFVELRQGHLRVGHMFDHYQEILNIGRALNDDRWHNLSLVLNQTSGEITVTVDKSTEKEFLKAYVWGNARNILDWSRLRTSIQFGAAREGTSRDYISFIGCLGNMKYSVDGAILQDIPVETKEGVTQGCVDRCQGRNKCKNNGRCVNLYTDFHCDCFGTDFEGRSCEKQGPTVLTFSGYEWITYQLYQKEENRPFSDHNRVALEFKTERPSGILVYAVGGLPYHNHVIATLHLGVLYVSVAFGDDDLDFSTGIGLDDNGWHNLTIVHSGRKVEVHLDGLMTSKSVRDGDFFLSLDPLLYFGGGDNFVITRGLRVTRNFVGCMKNVYFNNYSVLYKLSNKSDVCMYHGGERATFGCSPEQDIPISFPTAASVLHWSLGPKGENMSIHFQFRTVRDIAILSYLELASSRDGGGSDFGLIEVWIMNGHPMLVFIPSVRNDDFSENITLPIIVSDQQWHTMHIELSQSQAKLKVDAQSKVTQQYKTVLNHKGQVILGFGLRRYKQTEGFVGCLEQIVIQGKKLDPISVIESSSAIGLKLDGCYLIDYCSLNNICEHGSKCLSDWDGVQCDCNGNSYEGKACHFPHYPPSCDAYYQAGRSKSGTYLIDVDGIGPQDPTYVKCTMGHQRDNQLYGATIVEHNFASNTPVRGRFLEDRRYELTYREMNRAQLVILNEKSASCEQYFKYTCAQSPLLLGKKTWFKAADGWTVDYLGEDKPGFCSCPDSDDGTCDGKRCFCDHGRAEISGDEGYSNSKQHLPLMEMTFLQTRPSPGRANMTLGPLTCWGSVKQHLTNLVTLTTEESHLKLPAWTDGELGLHFKTHHDHALILMQTSTDALSGNRFTLKIISENSVEFYFSINGTVIREILRTHTPMNQGNWHYIFIEHDNYNVRLSLDTTRKLVSIDSAIKGILDFNSVVYLGGLPQEIANSYGEKTPGFSGCIRAFLYNKQEEDLSMLLDGTTNGVSVGCMSSCWPNPCEHGGTCKEEWGEYTCVCQDPWAHQGHNCEHNLNTDAVTFSGGPGSYLSFDLSKQPSALDQTIVLSFRTEQSSALLLYAYDQRSNFVQMELQQGNTILFTYNTYRVIVSGSITAPEPLNDGKWKQVVAQEYYNLTKLILGDQSSIIEHKRVKLNNFSIDPFKDSFQRETVSISRNYKEPAPFVRLFVGGVGEEGVTIIPFLNGCVRGMRIGSYHVNLSQGVQARGANSNLTAACDAGCKEDTCVKNGYCIEHWRYGNFTCDCSESDFSGIHCEKEASVMLNGQSVVVHTFTLPPSAQRTITEQLTFSFRTNGSRITSKPGKPLSMVLVYIKSTESKDYILAVLDAEGSVLIETNQRVGIYRMKVSGNFANGELHEFVYKREGSNMYLTLDGVKQATVVYPDHSLDQIDTIRIGGLLKEDEDEFADTTNFTGCISNSVFTPEANVDIKIRSLKDFHRNSPDVIVHGPEVFSCSSSMHIGKPVTEPPESNEVTSESFEMLTMPEWSMGPAKTVTLSPPVVLTQISTTTTTTTQKPPSVVVNRTQPLKAQSWEHTADDFTVVIAVSVIAGILVIVLIIAWLMFRKRKRRYEMKKEADIELKQPLNYHNVDPNSVPTDHLAKLDEFSMITALLGPKPTTGAVTHNSVESKPNRNSQGSLPKADDGLTFEHPIFNKRKQRPASSISEVLEELERRQNTRNNDIVENSVVGRPHGEGDLEWDPQADRTPLTYEDITFFNSPLLAPIPDDNEDSNVSSLLEQKSDLKQKPEDSSHSTDESQGLHNSLMDGNGDSGYEAESRPEITEDDVTPTGDDVGLDEEDDDDTTQPKLYMYNISNVDLEDSPIHSSPSRRLLGQSSRDS